MAEIHLHNEPKLHTRAQAEAEFTRALTRQIGYTAGAFNIQRMASIVEHFSDASAYQFELMGRLSPTSERSRELSAKYASDILSFATELGVISRIPSPAAPHLSRYILTDAGIAIRAARAVAPELELLVLEHLILENDADAYLRVLRILRDSTDASGDQMAEQFRKQIIEAREARFAWLQKAFPNKTVLSRLIKGSSHIHWLKVDKLGRILVDHPKVDFGRHHFVPRKSWAEELGHYTTGPKALTMSGLTFMTQGGALGELKTHWISPPAGCLSFLRIPAGGELLGPSAPTFDLLRPSALEEPPDEAMIQSAAAFLRDAFPHIRLFHARQAPIAPLKYFILQSELRLKRRFQSEKIVLAISKSFGEEFAFFSSRSGTLAYYQLRASPSV
jgi:hypothetical protein